MSSVDVIPAEEGRQQGPHPTLSPLLAVGRALHWIGWLIAGALLVIVFFRLVAWDDFQLFAQADALGPILYLPAWVVGVAAVATRKWFLLGACLIVVAAQLAFGLPELTAAEPVPADAAHAFKIRLLDANVYQANPSMAGYAAQIHAYRPDLVTLEEASPDDRAQLERAGAFRGLPHIYEVSITGSSRAFVIASRYPLGQSSVSSLYGGFNGGLPFLVRTSLRLSGVTIPLWVVHTTAPVNPHWQNWNSELEQIDQMLQARNPAPLLMVGDFNATWGNRWFRAILDTGLTDAAAARGEPFDMTWSQEFFLLPPLFRFDHVLTNASLAVTTIQSHPGPGSDHRELQATVAVLPSAYRDHGSAHTGRSPSG